MSLLVSGMKTQSVNDQRPTAALGLILEVH